MLQLQERLPGRKKVAAPFWLTSGDSMQKVNHEFVYQVRIVTF